MTNLSRDINPEFYDQILLENTVAANNCHRQTPERNIADQMSTNVYFLRNNISFLGRVCRVGQESAMTSIW